MDEQQFREKVLVNPDLIDSELVAVARDNPALQAILDEARQLNRDIRTTLEAVAVPDSLAAKLRAIPERHGGNPEAEAANDSLFPYYALVASLVMAVGISVAAYLRPAPSADDVTFGEVVLKHIYVDSNELLAVATGRAITAVPQPSANRVMANADSILVDSNALRRHPVLFARPCPIQPDNFDSAHLIVRGSRGAVNVIVTNNSPVATEFSISDKRFQGIVIPSARGNIVVIGEKDENLSEFKGLFSAGVEWII